MKLIDIIKSNNWLSVEMTLSQLYPDQEDMLDEYKSVFEHLNRLAPVAGNMRIVLTEQQDCGQDDESEIETYVDVSGLDDTTDENGGVISYAMEFTEWAKWLGMDLARETLRNFSELEIIAHCLYEMTFLGFNESKIQEERNSLDKIIENYKNLSEDERKQNTITLDELLKRLDEEEDQN